MILGDIVGLKQLENNYVWWAFQGIYRYRFIRNGRMIIYCKKNMKLK